MRYVDDDQSTDYSSEFSNDSDSGEASEDEDEDEGQIRGDLDCRNSVNTAATSARYHKRHTQLMSITDAYAHFRKSQELLQWSDRNAGEVIDKNGPVKRVLGSIGLELLHWVRVI